jgi:ATP-dependent DNA helicase RecQ
VLLRESVSLPADARRRTKRASPPTLAVAGGLTGDGEARFAALRSWRAEVARAHNLPAYVIFHDATLAAIAARAPQSLRDLQGISGIGASKLEKYGEEVLRVVEGFS